MLGVFVVGSLFCVLCVLDFNVWVFMSGILNVFMYKCVLIVWLFVIVCFLYACV